MKKKLGRRTSPRMSHGELEIISLLWENGELSLAEAHRAAKRPIGYTTMQTRLNRLVDKGLVSKTDDRPARYSASVTQDAASSNHLNVLLERVTQGRIVPLVANLVNDRSLTREEIMELKRLISRAEQRLKQGKTE